jgi:hypothetical protein
MNLEGIDSPEPLRLIPYDPTIDNNDSVGIEILERKLRASITSFIGRSLDEEQFDLDENEIMKAAIDVWDYWDDRDAKKALVKSVRSYINPILKEIRKSGAVASYQHKVISVNSITPKRAKEIRKYLTSTKFRKGKIDWDDSSQMEFGDVHDDWQ